jgi:hypothetical protein
VDKPERLPHNCRCPGAVLPAQAGGARLSANPRSDSPHESVLSGEQATPRGDVLSDGGRALSHTIIATIRFWVTQVSIAVAVLPLVAAVVLVPGALPAIALRRRLDASSATLVPIAASVSVAVLGILAEVAYFAHIGLDAVFVAFGVVSITAGAALVGSRDWRGMRWEREPLLIAGAAGLLSLAQGAWTSGDSAYHLAATRSLLVFNRPLVTDPYYGMANAPIDATSGSWHTMMAFASRVTHLDVLTLWPSLTALGAVILVLGFWSLAAEVAGSARAASVATVSMIVAMYLADFRELAYPGFISRGLLFIAIWAMVRALWKPSAVAALAIALLGSGAVAVHLGTAEMYFLAAAALVLVGTIAAVQEWRLGSTAKAGLFTLVTGVIGAVASVGPITLARVSTIAGMDIAPVGFELWRRYLRIMPGVYFPRPLWFRQIRLLTVGAVPTIVLGVLSLVVLGLVMREAIRTRSPLAWGAVGVVGLPIALAVPPLSLLIIGRSEYMLVRLLDVLDCLAFVGVAWALARKELWRNVSARRLAMAYLGVALLCAVPNFPGTYRGVAYMWASDRRLYWGADSLARLKTTIGRSYPRIASDVGTGYAMLAFEPISLVAGHPVHSPYYVELTNGSQRRDDMKILLDPSSSAQTRLSLVSKYSVDFVLVSPSTPNYKQVIASLEIERTAFKEVLVTKRLWLFQPTTRQPK